MSTLVLARKYRPKSFETLVGQEHVVKALTHALNTQRLHHAWLFTGTRGVGKTTISRILAKALNCETGVSATPCGVCSTCVAIDAGRFIDYIEMDAASNRGIDEMTQILESAPYKLDSTRYKVLMIDEVHMLTNTAFNAMLKTLEEPPEHVKFILATTDPQKIPVTVLSRCLQFNLKQMPPPQIIGHLEKVLTDEAVPFELPALRLIAQAAQGSMRDALSLTDQAVAYSAGSVTAEAARGMLGTIESSYLIRILDTLDAGDAPSAAQVAEEIGARSLPYGGALSELGRLLSLIALAQSAPQALSPDLPEREDLLRLARALPAEAVQLYYQIALQGRHELPQAPDETTGFLMTLLRMHAFRPVSESGAGHATKNATGGASSGTMPPRSPTSQSLQTGSVAKSLTRPASDEIRAAVPVAAAPSSADAPTHGSFDGDWAALIARLPLTGFVRAWAAASEFTGLEAGVFRLTVGHQKLADDRAMQEKLRTAIEQYLGRPTKLAVSVGSLAGTSVAATEGRAQDARQQAAESSIANDPFVKELTAKTGARVTKVEPL